MTSILGKSVNFTLNFSCHSIHNLLGTRSLCVVGHITSPSSDTKIFYNVSDCTSDHWAAVQAICALFHQPRDAILPPFISSVLENKFNMIEVA